MEKTLDSVLSNMIGVISDQKANSVTKIEDLMVIQVLNSIILYRD